MKKFYFFTITLLILSISCNQGSKKQLEPKEEIAHFVQVDGQHFAINGKPYYFTGVNMWYAANLGATPEGQKRLVKELDTLIASGVTNVRILGVSEKSELIASIKDAIHIEPGVYNEELLKGLDFTLVEMDKRGMKAVVFLNNYWQWSGGMSQYVSWATGEPIPDPDATGDWHGFMRFSARFYSIPEAIKINRNYIKDLINRTNTVSGKKYSDDPAIMAWELSNEPRPGTDDEYGEKNIKAFMKWIDETAAYIHSLDSNHLVTTGTEGKVGCIGNSGYFMKTHQSEHIDYVNLHCWAKNWGWFDAKNIEGTLDSSIIKATAYINEHIEMARQLNKPITFEEFGLDRDNAEYNPGTPVTARDRYYKVVFDLVAESAASNSPLAGTNLWAWGGLGQPTHIDSIAGNPMAFLGDPFCEPQGLNSVFVSDVSTLKIISEHSKKLDELTDRNTDL